MHKNEQEYDKWSQGIGQATHDSISSILKNQSQKVEGCDGSGRTNGNGTLMRLAPIPIGFSTHLSKCLDYAKNQSYATHNGEEAAECCKLISFILWKFLNYDKVEECRDLLTNLDKNYEAEFVSVQYLIESKMEPPENLKLYDSTWAKVIEDRDWNWRDKKFKYGPTRSEWESILAGIYCMDCVAMSLSIIYHTNSFKEALLKAINLGGDADTVGAVVGMLAGAMYGYSDWIKEGYCDYIAQYDEFKIAIRTYKLLNMSYKL
jgi:ADP-ribosylglycohydrolase